MKTKYPLKKVNDLVNKIIELKVEFKGPFIDTKDNKYSGIQITKFSIDSIESYRPDDLLKEKVAEYIIQNDLVTNSQTIGAMIEYKKNSNKDLITLYNIKKIQ
ncbi:MAG: hypothetical protein ACP5NV_05330 [Candidatus Woesearchaeota archaeon]